MSFPKIRVGFGYDVHQLSAGRKMIIGGVEVPSDFGPVGHSDADVLLHAICDALLGAAGMRDIGFHFSDSDEQYKNIDSQILLKKVYRKISAEGWKIQNIDSTLCLEKPKIMEHVSAMRKKISKILSLEENAISIKATTGEKMGFIGRSEGIEAMAVALLIK